MAGRPKKELTEKDAEKITDLASKGLGILDITRAMGISWNVFNREREDKKYIRDALKKGQSLGLAEVSSALFENATKKNSVVAQIFYLKNRAPEDWSDRTTQEVNINLKEIINGAKDRIAQHNVNERIIEGEIIENTRIAKSVDLPTNKDDTKKTNKKNPGTKKSK
tara:strand:- start:278 stop:775 length:498 start_codon:yes stop_codon:yes gene_type:complete